MGRKDNDGDGQLLGTFNTLLDLWEGSTGVRTSGRQEKVHPAKKDVVLFTHLPDTVSRLRVPDASNGAKSGYALAITVGKDKGSSQVPPVRVFFSVPPVTSAI